MTIATTDIEKITQKINSLIEERNFSSLFEFIKINSYNHELTVSNYFNLFEVLEENNFPTMKQNGSETFSPFINYSSLKRDNRKSVWKKLTSTMFYYLNREDIGIVLNDKVNAKDLANKDIIHKVNEIKKLWETRRSGESQSGADLKAVLKVWKNGGTIMFCDESSSFKDEGFLRALQYCIDNEIREIEVFSYSRTDFETVTRSFENARRIITFITQNLEHFDHIIVGGLDLLHNLNQSMFLMIISTIEGVWLNLANTKFYKKHLVYMEVLNNETELSSLPEVPKKSASGRALANQKEYKALLNYNTHNKNKMMDKIVYLQEKEKVNKK